MSTTNSMNETAQQPPATATTNKPTADKKARHKGDHGKGGGRRGRPNGVNYQLHRGVVLPEGFVANIEADGRRRIVLPGDAAWLNADIKTTDATGGVHVQQIRGQFTGELALHNCYGHHASGQLVVLPTSKGQNAPAPSALIRLPIMRENKLERAEFNKLVSADELGPVLAAIITNETVSVYHNGRRHVVKLEGRAQELCTPQLWRLKYTTIDERAMRMLGDDRGQVVEFLLERALGARWRLPTTQANGFSVGATHRRGNIQGLNWSPVAEGIPYEQAKALLYWERPSASIRNNRLVVNSPGRIILIDPDLVTILLEHTAQQIREHAPRLLGSNGLAQSPDMAQDQLLAALSAAYRAGVGVEALEQATSLLQKITAATVAKARAATGTTGTASAPTT